MRITINDGWGIAEGGVVGVGAGSVAFYFCYMPVLQPMRKSSKWYLAQRQALSLSQDLPKHN